MSYHSAMFCGHSHSGSGVTMIPVCHVISQDHVSKMSCDFYEREPFMISHYHSKFGFHRHCGSGNMMF